MTQDEMYNDIREQLRNGETNPVNAIYNTIKKAAKIECMPYHKAEKHLYIRIDNIPFISVEVMAFLARANNMETKFCAAEKNDVTTKIKSVYPYLHIYVKN